MKKNFNKALLLAGASLMTATSMFTSCSDNDDFTSEQKKEEVLETGNSAVAAALCNKVFLNDTKAEGLKLFYQFDKDGKVDMIRILETKDEAFGDTIHCSYNISPSPIKTKENGEKVYELILTTKMVDNGCPKEMVEKMEKKGLETKIKNLMTVSLNANNEVNLYAINDEKKEQLLLNGSRGFWDEVGEALKFIGQQLLNIYTKPIKWINDVQNEMEYGDKIGPTCYYNWMHNIKGDTPLCKMDIPGTHDTFTFAAAITSWWGKTQMYNLEKQWNLGVRYFDVRLDYQFWDGYASLEVTHGGYVDCDINLPEVFEALRRFLNKYPSETCFVDVTFDDESGKEKEAQYVLNNFLSEEVKAGLVAKWYPGITLKEARGKIVVITDEFNSSYGYVPGIAYQKHNNGEYSNTYGDVLYNKKSVIGYKVQNDYERGNDRSDAKYVSEKTDKMIKNYGFQNAEIYWKRNNTSGYLGNNATMNYPGLGETTNAVMEDYLKTYPGLLAGVVLMDFAGLSYPVSTLGSCSNPNCKTLPETIVKHNQTLSYKTGNIYEPNAYENGK